MAHCFVPQKQFFWPVRRAPLTSNIDSSDSIKWVRSPTCPNKSTIKKTKRANRKDWATLMWAWALTHTTTTNNLSIDSNTPFIHIHISLIAKQNLPINSIALGKWLFKFCDQWSVIGICMYLMLPRSSNTFGRSGVTFNTYCVYKKNY